MKSHSTDISDDRIIQLLQEDRDYEKGFHLLMNKYQERLYWHIRRMVSGHEDANDVLQNCMMKVFRNIGSFEGRSMLYTWLYRIATNEAISFLKKQKKRQATSIDNEDMHLANRLEADIYFDGDEAQRRLHRALKTLPDKQKVVFNMRYFEEMSYQQMSDMLETSVGALKASYHHAVKKIEKYVREVDPS